jgi:hypothetical protein
VAQLACLGSLLYNSAGLTSAGFGIGVAVADYDNDGREDLFMAGVDRNVLYRAAMVDPNGGQEVPFGFGCCRAFRR